LPSFVLKQPAVPTVPALRPPRALPAACAASSMTASPCPDAKLQGRRVSHPAPQVHRHDRPGPRGDLAGRVFVVQVQGGRVAVDEHRRRPELDDWRHGHDDGQRREKDLVPGADPEGVQRGTQRRSAGGDRDGMPDAECLGQFPL
jgi:hypothetical protein